MYARAAHRDGIGIPKASRQKANSSIQGVVLPKLAASTNRNSLDDEQISVSTTEKNEEDEEEEGSTHSVNGSLRLEEWQRRV